MSDADLLAALRRADPTMYGYVIGIVKKLLLVVSRKPATT